MEIKPYFSEFMSIINGCIEDFEFRKSLDLSVELIKSARNDKKKVILIGNGGSSAVAEHMAIDLMKNAGVRAMAFSGTPQLTTLANDYGFEKMYSKAVESHADAGDVVIAISSGGRSKNILNAVAAAKEKKCKVITFSGFSAENPLRQTGDINFYVPSEAYGYVEVIHNLLIHYINDKIIGSAVYKSN